MGTNRIMVDRVRFNVISTGTVANGFQKEDVQKQLIAILKLKPEQAMRFFGRRRVIKKEILKAEAEKIQNRLAQLGVVTELERLGPPEPEFEPPPSPFDEVNLELVEDSEPKPEPEPTPPPVSAEQSVTGAPIGTTSQAVPMPTPAPTASRAKADREGITILGLVAALGAAFLGAWLWQWVAVTFEYELGFIAWGIGGAVGAAAAMFGSRGMSSGVICALIVVGSIYAGKYWMYSSFTEEAQSMIEEVMAEMDEAEMRGLYEQEMEDARIFARGSGSDTYIRQFMVDREYTDATSSSRIRTDELDGFRQFIAPRLRTLNENRPSFREWMTDSVSQFGNVFDQLTPNEMIREDFNFIDLIFLGLGMFTAFRLAAQLD
ncbi:MAG: hypothetical protein AAF578_11610 [Pseudomonadota bacterium]